MNLTKLISAVVFIAVFVAHALYVGACAASTPAGWTDFGIDAHSVGPLGLGAYWRGQDYFISFSYALAAAFATWALSRSILFPQGRTITAGAAAGGVTLLGALMAGGCFLIGCCGSPMLAVYLSLFGAKALGLGKPLMALVTLISVSCGYWCLSRRLARGSTCMEDCCSRSEGTTRPRHTVPNATSDSAERGGSVNRSLTISKN